VTRNNINNNQNVNDFYAVRQLPQQRCTSFKFLNFSHKDA